MTTIIKLTKTSIDALPLPKTGQRGAYHFDGVPGLQLRVTATGIKTFSVFKRIKGGNPERITLGRYPAVTPENAKREAAKYIADLVNGRSVAGATKTGKQEVTLGELFDDFLKSKRSRRGAYLSEATKRDYKSSFDLYFSKLSSRQLSKIKGADISALHTQLGHKHPTRANRIVALASSLFSYAKESKKFTGENPAAGIRKFPENSRDRFLQADELPRFFQALAKEPNTTIRDYVLLSLLTGARRSNVLSMKWADVNLERGEWRITKTKNGTPQTVTLSLEAVDILATRKAPESPMFVFPGIGKSGHLIEPKKGWKRILDRAELIGLIHMVATKNKWSKEQLNAALEMSEDEDAALTRYRSEAKGLKLEFETMRLGDLRIHDLRRTLGSWQAKTGASLAIIGKSLHHKTTQATVIYARLDLDPVRASVDLATSAMLMAAGLKDSPATKKPGRLKKT
jgi:integrase